MWRIWNNDILKWAEHYDGPPFHSILCDPPYNLDTIKKRFGKTNAAPAKYGTDGVFQRSSKGFMGKDWDTDVAFQPELWEMIMKHLYPGALCTAFSSTRTYHRMALAIEQAGFIIHPMIGWIQAQGFPKATNPSKLIEKRMTSDIPHETWKEHRYGLQTLKPSFEPICVFQKPFDGAPLDNIIETGAGTVWIDGNRIGDGDIPSNQFDDGMKPFGHGAGHPYTQSTSKGRWPANVVLSGDVGLPYEKFFFCAKANKTERNLGLDEFPEELVPTMDWNKYDRMIVDADGGMSPRKPTVSKNTHPTVKPIKLTEHLARLFLPPQAYEPRRMLVPFSGSGSEMIGSLLAGWDEIHGVEIERESCDISQARMEYWVDDKRKEVQK